MSLFPMLNLKEDILKNAGNQTVDGPYWLPLLCKSVGSDNCLVLQNIYRVLAWNYRWHIPIGLTQSDPMTSLSHGTADWFSPESVANELSAQHSNIWLVLVVAVSQHASETLHLPHLHLYRSATRWFMYGIGGSFMYDIFAAAVFLTCSQQHVVDVIWQ